MNSKFIKVVELLLAIVMAIGLLAVGIAQAQKNSPATEPDGDAVEYIPPSYDSGDPSYLAAGILPPDENQTYRPQAPNLTFSYYQVSGATLRGRNSTTGYLYDGVGCSHVTEGSGSGRILNTELILPDNSVIKYLRVYYRDTNAANGVEGYITRYQPGAETADLIHAGSSDAYVGGYGFVVSQEITETVNNTVYAYTLIGWPDDVNVANQICGLRVAYYAPPLFATFLPVIQKSP
ncbi:MAG: hypothetical protein A2W35_18520 [Chloroflexi bacterium RBG_16_57_11]|nr:MAG: hypothetical protein A2W35_18520 [Chloroflexi bacterium RBG_16_57_11]